MERLIQRYFLTILSYIEPGTPQNIRSFIEWIGKHRIDTKTSRITQTLQEGIKILHNTKKITAKRLISFIHRETITDDAPVHRFTNKETGEVTDIIDLASQMLEDLQKNQAEQNVLEMTIVCSTNSDNRSERTNPMSLQVGNIHCTVYVVKTEELLQKTQKIASLHFRLRSIRIKEIPMKEGDKERITYDVLLLHPAEEHSLSSDSQDHCNISLDAVDSNELTLHWKIDKTLNKSAMTCSCIHRLTTVNVCC